MTHDQFAPEPLFAMPSQQLSLVDRFLVPPFSVFDARAGYWQARKGAWLALGIQSELGRGGNLLNMSDTVLSQWGGGAESAQQRAKREEQERRISDSRSEEPFQFRGAGNLRDIEGLANKLGYSGEGEQAWGGAGTSIFDPVICELLYRWFTPAGGKILDPFAGGSVRGIVAGVLGRRYLGVDLRAEQVAANEQQRREIGASVGWEPGQGPEWACGDSREVAKLVPGNFDFLFSCPPYFDLEQYSDDPADLSNAANYATFRLDYYDIIEACAGLLKEDRFAAFVVGEVRDKAGNYIGLVPDTIEGFRRAGLQYYNEAILVTAVGSLPIRTPRIFPPGRKLGKTHQNVLVFCKGDSKRAADACEPLKEVVIESGGVTVPVEVIGAE